MLLTSGHKRQIKETLKKKYNIEISRIVAKPSCAVSEKYEMFYYNEEKNAKSLNLHISTVKEEGQYTFCVWPSWYNTCSMLKQFPSMEINALLNDIRNLSDEIFDDNLDVDYRFKNFFLMKGPMDDIENACVSSAEFDIAFLDCRTQKLSDERISVIQKDSHVIVNGFKENSENKGEKFDHQLQRNELFKKLAIGFIEYQHTMARVRKPLVSISLQDLEGIDCFSELMQTYKTERELFAMQTLE